jgi:mycothiol synthase
VVQRAFHVGVLLLQESDNRVGASTCTPGASHQSQATLPRVTDQALEAIGPAQFADVHDRVARIERAATVALGHASLGDAHWRDLNRPGSESAGFFLDDAAYAHVSRAENDAGARWALGLTVASPSRREPARTTLIEAALRHIRAHGGGLVTLWMLGAQDTDDAAFAAVGLEPARDLYLMRVPLPITERPRIPPGFDVRPFDHPGDDAAWLDVNNRAFAGHAEQGGWTLDTLARRIDEDWFDPSLFLCAFDAEGLAAFNWLRLHTDESSKPLGEIYVIGVHPRAQGTGLGKALAIAGLDAVFARGARIGMLFVAAENTPALGLYQALGFTIHRVDRAYEVEI